MFNPIRWLYKKEGFKLPEKVEPKLYPIEPQYTKVTQDDVDSSKLVNKTVKKLTKQDKDRKRIAKKTKKDTELI